MNKLITVILGLLLSSACYASGNWVKIMENGDAVLFLDKGSITQTQVEHVKRAELIFNNKKNAYSTVTVYEINCKSKQDHRVKISDYEKADAQGKLLGSQVINEPLEPADQRAVDLICH